MTAYITIVGYFGIIASYLFYMFRRRPLNWVIWVKLTFIATFVFGAYFKMNYWRPGKELLFVSFLSLIVILAEFIYNKRHQEREKVDNI